MSTTSVQQEAAVGSLVDQGVLSKEQAGAVLAALHATPEPARGRGGWWVEVLGYAGGGLLLAGAATLVGISWPELSRAGHVALLAGVTAALVGAAALIAGRAWAVWRTHPPLSPVRRRIVGVLLALASITAALSVGVAVDNQPDLLAPLAGVVVATVGYALARTVPTVLAMAAFSVLSVSVGIEHLSRSTMVAAVALIALGLLWLGLGLSAVVRPLALAVGIGAGLALVGAQVPVTDGRFPEWGYALTTAVAVGCLLLYRRVGQVVLLLAGVLGVTLVAPEVVWDLTNGAGGGAAILIVSGIVLLAASGLGLHLHTRASQRVHHGTPAAPLRH